MKKILNTIIIFALLVIINNISFSYSTDQYSISIPSSFSKVSEGYFVDNNGESISIQVSPNINTKGFKYNEKNLNSYVEKIQSTNLSNYNVNILKKEITKFSNNNYECFHISYQVSSTSDISIYAEQYILVGQNIGYILTITGNSSNYINSSTVNEIVNSFTAVNFKEIETIWDKILITTISTIILLPLFNLMKKKNSHNTFDIAENQNDNYIQPSKDYYYNEEVKYLINKIQSNNTKKE